MSEKQSEILRAEAGALNVTRAKFAAFLAGLRAERDDILASCAADPIGAVKRLAEIAGVLSQADAISAHLDTLCGERAKAASMRASWEAMDAARKERRAEEEKQARRW